MAPAAGSRLQAEIGNAQVTPDNLIACRVYRDKAGLFGANHPGKIAYDYTAEKSYGYPLRSPQHQRCMGYGYTDKERLIDTLVLDGDFGQIKEGDKVLISLPELHELHGNRYKRVAAGAVLSTSGGESSSRRASRAFGLAGKGNRAHVR